jgi:hypothetical protein
MAIKTALSRPRKQSCREIFDLICDKSQLTSEQHGWFMRAHKLTKVDQHLYELAVNQELPPKLAGQMIGNSIAKRCSSKPVMHELVSFAVQEFLLTERENNPLLLFGTTLSASEQDELLCENIEAIADRHITLLIRAYKLATVYRGHKGYAVAKNMLSNIYVKSRWSVSYPWHNIQCERDRLKKLEGELAFDVLAWGVAGEVAAAVHALLNTPSLPERLKICDTLEKVVSPTVLDEFRVIKWPPAVLDRAFLFWTYAATVPFVSD